jgi:hypothetical protein
MKMNEAQANVNELIKRLPEGYERACVETKAMERRREIKTPIDLIKLILLYLVGGFSQVEMSVIAKESEIAKIGDTGFLKKFAKSKDWLAWMVSQNVPKPIVEYSLLDVFNGYTLAAIDATNVTEKGRSKQIFRLHYAINLLTMCCLSSKITAQKVGETLKNFNLKEKWIVLGDRAYGTLTSIEHCLVAKADFVLRLKYGAFKLYNADGSEVSLIEKLKKVTSKTAADIEVYAKLPLLGFYKLRICAIKIPSDKLDKVDRRNKKRASRKQLCTSDEALQMSHYVVVITSLPMTITASEIIALYRLRWQVEIYFKRLKTIMDFGNVPLKRADSIEAWMNGKLLIALLVEQMLSEVSFSPCGENVRNKEHLERVTTYLSNAPKEYPISS